uniref:NADH-ubiquinone oxidoreductase chain 3 n=1 Tax=Prionopetalum kraepelini TaxID=2931675 RepID=A0A8T9JB32_9MYRI|nr:NADH dehydrogenase subunit 3 [Prionopetalum kraepelini]UOF70471.1 NADH dehydrogenase subunit 3 [Prionopetalum kraepelini]
MTLIMFFTLFAISSIIVIIPSLTSYLPSNDRENSSPFECGFDPKNNSRLPFSLQFFLIAVIFLIFDVEIALLLPIPLIMTNLNSLLTMLLVATFLIILLLGLYFEWVKGALNWMF